MPRSRHYWICMIGYQLSYVLALIAFATITFVEIAPVRMLAGMSLFAFGAGARVFWERADAEFKRLGDIN